MGNDDHWDVGGRRAGGRSASRFAQILLFVVAAFVVSFVLWARDARLDEVARGQGRVLPPSEIQVVRNRDGGVLSRIDVVDGAVVEKDQVLLRIDNVAAASGQRKARAKFLSLTAVVARLEAEAADRDRIDFPNRVLTRSPSTAENERNLFQSRRARLDQQIRILRDQAAQRRQELVELTAKAAQNKRAFDLAQQELDILRPLVDRGISPKLEFLRVQQKVQELETVTESVTLAVPRSRAALREAEARIDARRATFRAEAQRELNDRRAERDGVQEAITVGAARATWSEIRSPVRGTVSKIFVNTIGGAVPPGQKLVEIVPLVNTLLIEAKIRPADRARLFPGLKAVVKFPAYDPAEYGGLDAVLTAISAESITGQDGKIFYRIRLRADTNNLDPGKPIVPGMAATAEILTGRRTVLDYLLKPIVNARDVALRER